MGALVASVLAVIALLTPTAFAATPSPATVGTVQCFDGGGFTTRLTISVIYQNNGNKTCSFTSEYDWMTAAKDTELRGISGVSGYKEMIVNDDTNRYTMTVRAAFNCYSASQPCAVTAEHGVDGGSSYWTFGYKTSCGAAEKNGSSAEYQAWLYFFQNVYHVENGDATLASTYLTDPASGNKVTDDHC